MTFDQLNLIDPIKQALSTQGYTTPTPIQAKAIPHILEGRDILGCAQTGTGKTAAFAIPILQLLTQNKKPHNGKRPTRCLILTPTRELAIQIGESFEDYGSGCRINSKVIFGGVSQTPQVASLKSGVDILIATPGRLLDLMQQKHVDLKDIEFFVLDEADRMLDMGFVNDVKRVIAKLPTKRQSLFFSATMPSTIQQLADSILTNPIKVEVTPASSTAKTVSQTVYFVDKLNKKHLLMEVLEKQNIDRVLVFTRTKHGADKVAKDLNLNGIKALSIHGNKSQVQRQKALNSFKSSETRILVATDIAARGIDIDELTHVINYELPNVPEQYVHRIGRTGRAGSNGIAIAFCDSEEKEYLRDIQKVIGIKVEVVEDHSYPLMIHEVIKTVREPRPPRADRVNNRPGYKAQRSEESRPQRDDRGNRDSRDNRDSGGYNRDNRRESSYGSKPSFGGSSSRGNTPSVRPSSLPKPASTSTKSRSDYGRRR